MAVQAGRFFVVGELIRRFERAGCEIRTAETTTYMPDGDVLNIRYLLAPSREHFVPLVDLADEDRVSEAEVEFWEEMLGVSITRP